MGGTGGTVLIGNSPRLVVEDESWVDAPALGRKLFECGGK